MIAGIRRKIRYKAIWISFQQGDIPFKRDAKTWIFCLNHAKIPEVKNVDFKFLMAGQLGQPRRYILDRMPSDDGKPGALHSTT